MVQNPKIQASRSLSSVRCATTLHPHLLQVLHFHNIVPTACIQPGARSDRICALFVCLKFGNNNACPHARLPAVFFFSLLCLLCFFSSKQREVVLILHVSRSLHLQWLMTSVRGSVRQARGKRERERERGEREQERTANHALAGKDWLGAPDGQCRPPRADCVVFFLAAADRHGRVLPLHRVD